MGSFSRRSIERVALASRPALKRPFGSSRDAPLKKLILTCSLKAPREMTFPLWVQTGVPHFQSSFRLGSASLMRLRSSAMSLAAPVGKVGDLLVDFFGRGGHVIQLSWLNMSLPLAVVSGTCWRTSQCSMILPSSLRRKMSMPAIFQVL